MRRLLLAVACAAVTALPAAAATGIRITRIDPTAYPTLDVTVVTSRPASRPLLRQDGITITDVGAENLSRGANVVVAIDRSRSMAGTALTDAAGAARTFIARKPAATRVEIVAFGRSAVQLTGMSSATTDADQALGTITVDKNQGTALWDAVILATRALDAQPAGGRVLVLLTDGADTSSKGSVDNAIAASRKAGVAIYPIGIESKAFSPDALARLARETGGSYHSASSTSSLESVYASIAGELERTWHLSYATTARPGDTATLDVSIPGIGAAQQTLRIPAALGGGAVSSKPSSLIPAFAYSHGVGALVLMLIVGIATLTAVGLLTAATGGKRLRRRIDPHVRAPQAAKTFTKRDRLAAADGLLRVTDKAFARFSLFAKLQHLLDRADLPLRAAELFYICVGCAFVPAFLFAFAGAPSLVLLVVMALGASFPVGVVWFKARQRLRRIDDGLPDLLITVAASLKAGHSFRQGLAAATDEDQGPITKEFKRVLTETSLGRPMDDALIEMADRVGSKDLEFVITAVTIQRQVGGSLAGIFDLVADTIRQRQQFSRKIRGLTAMGRMSAYTLIGLPFFIGAVLTLINGAYMSPLYTTHTGHMLIVVGLMMMAFGSLILKKIVSFRG